ncbi:MAG: hypothetical protein A2Z88_08190 [Omnitrophica WOR_2 bacterium GWA2_47_8]|nr:MAG: hypothetical protein A2Z88_08190 [Omnitrophica WOR_2 bacterium GWA2_47_8]
MRKFFAFSVLIALLVSENVSLAVPNRENDVELFIGGHKYHSIREYKETLKQMESQSSVPALSQAPSGPAPVEYSDDFIRSFLGLTLDKFNDEELKLFINEFKKQRVDLFEGNTSNTELMQMQHMLTGHATGSKYNMDVSLDPSKIKTIAVDPQFRQMQDMLTDYITTQDSSVDYKLDPTKIKTVTIASKPPSRRDMALGQGSAVQLAPGEMDKTLNYFKKRAQGPLTFYDQKVFSPNEASWMIPWLLWQGLLDRDTAHNSFPLQHPPLSGQDLKLILKEFSTFQENRKKAAP